MSYFSQEKQKGFTLLELMITIAVISIGMIGIFGMIQRTMQSAEDLKSRLITAYLAQEGIELVRNIRDTNWFEGKDWDDGLTGCSSSCEISFDEPTLKLHSGDNLSIDGSGFYGKNGIHESQFKREVFIENTGDYLEVKVKVSWEEEQSFEVIKHLYQWWQ